MPKVSIIIPSFNAEKYIKETIDSILAQTFTDFELLIVDDSTDNTPNIIKLYSDPRIILIIGEKKGGSRASNIGLKQAHGEYIARMDADDIMVSERLQKQVDFLDSNPDIALCGSNMMTTEGWAVDHSVLTPQDIRTRLMFSNSLCHPTVMWRRLEFEKHNLSYNETLKGCEDYELWLRATGDLELANLPERLVTYRIHEGQNSNYLDRDAEIIKQMTPIYIKKYLDVEIPKNLRDLLVDYSQPHYTKTELLQLHDVIIQLLEKIKSNPKFSYEVGIIKLSREYARILTSSLNIIDLYLFTRKIQTISPLEIHNVSKKYLLKYILKKYTPGFVFKMLQKIYRIIKNGL